MEIVDAATKLAQGGVVVILLTFIIGMAFAMRYMFRIIIELSQKAYTTVESATRAIESHTRAVEANARASEANSSALESLKGALELFLRKP